MNSTDASVSIAVGLKIKPRQEGNPPYDPLLMI